jgi:hypothetical protein
MPGQSAHHVLHPTDRMAAWVFCLPSSSTPTVRPSAGVGHPFGQSMERPK